MSKPEKEGGGDSRKAYILRVASHILSLNLVEEKLPNAQALYSFCDTTTPVLAISRSDQKGHIELANEIRYDKPALFRVVFFKTRPTVLSMENYKNDVSVITMHENANETLLGTIHQVFSKMFSQRKDLQGKNQIAGLVTELEENLLLAVDTSKSGAEGVVSLEDEIKLWKARRSSSKDPGHYADAFDPVAEKLNLLDGIPIEEVMEFIELAEDCIDALWNSDEPYPQKRMKQLIQAFDNRIFDAICSKYDSKTLWRADKSADELRTAISICDQWLFSINLLTSQTWPQNALHEWEGEPMRTDFFKGFRNRLDETLSLRILTNQIVELLKDKSMQAQIVETIEGAMKGFDPVYYSPFTEAQWKSRLQTVERTLDPLIDRAIPILKTRFQPSKMDSNLILEDIYKYRHFLSRSNVKAKLLADRETLVSRLLDSLKIKKKEYNDRIRMSDIVVGRYLTEIAAKLIWIRQQTSQMDKLHVTCSNLLDDIPTYSNLEMQIRDFVIELKAAESEQFDSWCREVVQSIDEQNGSVALQTTGRLMVLERERGVLNVSYSDRLVRLIREVRQLLSIGFAIPAKILHCVQTGEQFYRHGILLKQVAHFYNTIEQQMLPCQQALMLDEALAFEKLVIPGKNSDASVMNVTWEDPQKLQAYIEKLQEAAFRLTNHNRRLRKIHMEIAEKAIKLMSIDLVKEEDKWSALISEIRQKFSDEERHVSNKSNMRPWAIHWDRQLYKVLQIQFQWGLESLQSVIPTINAQLIFREQRLQLRPPLEEIKAKYYKELRKFLSIPQKFRGMQNAEKETSFFATMIARNATRFQGIYERSVRLFERVEAIDQQFEDWVVLGKANMEDLIEENFKKASDWETELKSLKSKGRDVERLPTEIRIECILISTSGAKSAIEDLLHRMYDTLTWTLRHSITTELQLIGQTLTQGIDLLAVRPQSLDEVAEANQNHMKLMKSNREIREQMTLLDEKNQLLRSVGGAGVENLSSTKSQFEKFETMLETHEEVIREQLDVMKSNVSDRIRLLNEEAERLAARWHQFKPKSEVLSEDRAALVKALEFIREKRQQFDELNGQKEKIFNDCTQFGLEIPEFTIMDEMQIDLEDFENNYLLYEKFNDELQKLAVEEWILFRSKTYLFDEFLSNWTDQLKAIPATPLTVRLQKDIDSMRELSASLKYCRGEMLSGDHWLELFRMVKLPKGTTLERLTFGDLLSVQANIIENVENLKNLNSRAQGEVTIREAIQELEVWAAQADFSLTEYKHSNGTTIKIIRDWKDSINQVKDNQALLQSLKNSPYYSQFKDQTSIWEKRITDLDVFLASMNEIQRKWVYLEPIFGRGSLPSEASRFNRVDVEFRVILQDIAKDSRLVALCNRASLGRTLEQLVDQLNRCQRALNEFLEEKRTVFPRFYFLGDDDLLEILGQSTNPTVIQSHLKKLFQGIDKVVFDNRNETIRIMVSAEGEHVTISKPVRIVPQVEVWLRELADEMKSTLKKLVADCLREEDLDPSKYPSQVLCLSEEIRFCRDVEQNLEKNGDFKNFHAQLLGQLEHFTTTQVDDRVLKLKLKALILDLIHHISAVEQLMETKNRSKDCWMWQKQLRFYFEGGSVIVRQSTAEFAYTYEYQGNAAKLVHTPLTDKCYLTLTQAQSMGLGGNPYGPAGTGKTESVKALANLMGRQVLVFNCDEGIDVHSIGRIFVGLIQCGAWGCFDEFNRLDQSVLSAVSTQVQAIQDAIRSKSPTCKLASKNVPVDYNSAIFITLNPAGKGYGGRQKLPDNLKQLFRPVVMSVPDNELIAETLLYAEGFKDAKPLARKLVAAFNLSREMLSTQQHYDWGLRALKTVLRGCGDAIAINRDVGEAKIVVQTLMLNTLSKLTFADSKRFRVLLDDIFPDVDKSMIQLDELKEQLKKAGEEMKLNITDVQVTKIFELYEQLRQRMGVVVVGPSGSGKSTLWKVLRKALGHMNQPVDVYTMNPKSMSRTRLLGYMDVDTREWTDGALTMASRHVVRDTSKAAWIICDGDIDPEWIEALNSVLDDNKLLTMPSGERIQFGENVNFLFETDDLSHASPATISRMGMIFISEEDLDVHEIIKQYIKSNEDMPSGMPDWLEGIYPALSWLQSKQNRDLPACSRVGIIENILSQIYGCRSKNEFLVGLMRGLAPYVAPEARTELAEQVVFPGMVLPDQKNPTNIYCDRRTDALVSFTDDYGISIQVEEMQNENARPFIMTARAQAVQDTIMSWLKEGNRKPFVIVGPDGCGKEKLLKSCFQADHNSHVVIMHCGAQTSAEHIEQTLMQHCVQVSSAIGRVLKPKDKENLILYMKSPNLSKPDKYGTSMLVAYLQQILAYGGYYDKNLDWIGLENIQLVISVSFASGTERFVLPTRFMSPLRTVILDTPNEDELASIYAVYLTPILKEPLQSTARIEGIAASMVRVFEKVRATFRAGDQIHYTFTPLDLTKWTVALMRYEMKGDDVMSILNRCLIYEASRIFRDRFINIDHKSRFDHILLENFTGKFNLNELTFATHIGPFHSTNSVGKELFAMSRKDFVMQMEKSINRFEFEVTNFGQPLSDDLADLCLALDRILTMPGGSVVLAGRPGMGRKAAVSLVAHMHQIKIFTPKTSSTYTLKHFSNDLKLAMQWAAVDGEQVVFIIEDFQLLQEAFLQYLNSILSAGNVPGLYTPQEFEPFSNTLRNLALQDAYDGTLHDYFSYKVKQNLHLAIIMDITNPDFNSRIVRNPSLYKNCTVIWKDILSRDTLAQITAMALKKRGMEMKNDVIMTFSQIFESSPKEVQLPGKFIAFIENFFKIDMKKRDAVRSRLNRLKSGVDKLTETRDAVAKMQKKSAKKSKLLAEKQAEADRALSEITQSMTGATEQKADMEQLKLATEKENVRIEEQKKVIEEQLKEVEPLLKEAREAVGSIKSESLSEIRSLRAPPEAIRDILQAVLLFMGILDTSWEAMRKFLSKSSVKEEIINFDAHRITPDVAKKVSALVKSKEASFDPKNARRASVAAAPLAGWVTANLQYADILVKIAPLENEKNTLIRNLEKAEKQMDKLSKGLKTVDKRVQELKENFEVLMKDATQIKIDLDKEQATIAVAGTLVDRLSGEYTRWQEQMNTLQQELDTMEKCCLVAAGFSTFLGIATEDVREKIMKEWYELCRLANSFSVVQFLASETEQLNWKNKGLPASKIAVENTAMLFNNIQTPFIIDSTGKVCAFLVNYLKESGENVEFLKGGQSDLMTQIELGVRFGKTLIIDEVSEIDPALASLLRREFSSQGPRQVVQLGEKSVDVNEKFRMFLCSKNEQIQLPSFVRSTVSEANFSTTRSGLASQLLSLAIEIERPELEVRSSELTSQAESMTLQLDQLEQILLNELVNSEGSLLENVQLLDSLNKSKENADRIAESLKESEKLHKQLDEQRNVYFPFAQKCSQLYFVICNLHKHNPMYNFNVNTIFKLFKKAFNESKAEANVNTRLDSIYRAIQRKVYEYVSRALLKEDRLMFAMSFIKGTQANLFEKNEWELFSGTLVGQARDDYSVKNISWISEDRKNDISRLQIYLPTLFHTLRLEDQGTWVEFSKATNCESAFPSSVDSKITAFQKVLVIQSLRPDRLHSAMVKFASKALGLESINPPPLDLHSIFKDESVPNEPILILVGSGADPSQELNELANKVVGAHRFHQIAMGQGQETAVLETIRKCMEQGEWLCLYNLHLVAAFVPRIQNELVIRKPHDDFRLWLTTESDHRFPVVFLQESLKLTFEAPPGVKNNLERTYAQWRELELSVQQRQETYRLQAIFMLAWLHAILQERRSFIPQAWLKFYEFSNGDLRTARQMLDKQLTKRAQDVDWETIRGLIENAIYGGRVENMLDIGILQAYLLEFFNNKMIAGAENGSVLAPNFPMPTFSTYNEYSTWVHSTVPADDPPHLFGLPLNILFSWEIMQSASTISKLRHLQTDISSTSEFAKESWNEVLSPLLNLWKRLNQNSNLHSMEIPTPKPSDDPVAEVLSLEFVFAVRLMRYIHGSLANISKSIKGAIVPDAKTVEIARSLMLHQTPTSWDAMWAGPSTPVEYLETLVYKARCTQELSRHTNSSELLSAPLNLAQIFRPTALLNAFRQLSARKKHISMDSLKLATSWQSSALTGELCVQLSNIQIQGALFDGQLRSVSANSSPFSSIPNPTIAWISMETAEPYKLSESITIPLFADSDRAELVTHLRMPCSEAERNRWIIAGVALFLRQT